MKLTRARRWLLSSSIIAGLAGTVLGAPPAALDRVPTTAAASFTVREIEAFAGRLGKVLNEAPAPGMEEMADLAKLADKKLLETPGLDRKGSMAVFVMPDGGEANAGEEPGPVVVLVPVTDGKKFIESLGGNPADAIAALNVDGEQGFARVLDGYVAMSPIRELVEKYDGKGGNAASHLKAMGATGQRTADGADVLAVFSIDAMRPQLEAGANQAAMQADQMGMMAGQFGGDVGEGMGKAIGEVLESAVRDGQTGVLGFAMNDAGAWFDISIQFKADTELGKMFADSGNTEGLLKRLPSEPFLLSGAMDMSSPVARRIISNLGKQAAEGAEGAGGAKADSMMARLAGMADRVQGMSFVMGATDGLLTGGLLNRTAYHVKTSDPAAFVAATKEGIEKMNGRVEGPVTFATAYTSGAKEIKGKKVDAWKITPTVDQNDPMAANVEQLQTALYGEGEAGGMMAIVEGGVTVVMSQNTPLMSAAIEAGGGGASVGDDALLAQVRSMLPPNRSVEVFLGTKPILDLVNDFIVGFGGGEGIKTPDKMAPLAMAMAHESGGMTMRVYVPADVQTAIEAVRKAMNPPAEEPNAAPQKEDNNKPRF